MIINLIIYGTKKVPRQKNTINNLLVQDSIIDHFKKPQTLNYQALQVLIDIRKH